MCLICIEMSKNKLKSSEAWSNFSEMYETIEEEHIAEVFDKIMALEATETERDNSLFAYYDEWEQWGSD